MWGQSRVSTWVILLLVTILGAVSGQTSAQENTETEQLRREVDHLTAEVEALQGRVLRLERAMADDQEPQLSRYDDQGRPSKAILDKITLPENPSKQDIKTYISRLRSVSSQQRLFSTSDPQTLKLAEIGSENLAVLLQFNNLSIHELEAAFWLAGPEHRDMVIEGLPHDPGLVQVVVRKGWTEDARDVLIGTLMKLPSYLPTEWIKAVASFEDPSTYGVLKAYLVSGYNRSYTYAAIQSIPGLDLDSAVSEAWAKVKSPDSMERCDFAVIALNHGHPDAIEALLDCTESYSFDHYKSAVALQSLSLRLNFQGTPGEIRAWYEKNADRIVFHQGFFYVPKTRDHKP